MAHCKPSRVTTHGEARHLSQAVGAFILELSVDCRVQAYYLETWRVARRQRDQEFELLLAEHPETIELFIADAFAQEHAVTAPFVGALLQHLPSPWTGMVTDELLRAFRTLYYHDRTPPDERPAVPLFGTAVQLQPTHARGKVPHTPDVVQRNIRWLYRAYVQERRASRRTLAREYASWAGRDEDDCRRDVKDGLRQARALLDLAAHSDWRDPGLIVIPAK